MSQSSLDEFFSPVNTNPLAKRKERTSDSETDTPSKRLNLPNPNKMLSEQDKSDLINRFSDVMDSKIEKLKNEIPSKEDMTVISQTIASIVDENTKLKEEVAVLRKELSVVKDKMKQIDYRCRGDNLIFTGLRLDREANLHEAVTSFIRNELGILEDPMIGDVVHLSDATGGPLKVKFLRGSFIAKIFARTRRLRDTGFGIDRDYPDEVRSVRRKLFQARKEIMRANGSLRVLIRSDTMMIGREKFSWSDSIGITHGGADGIPKLSEIVGVDMTERIVSLGKDSSAGPPAPTPAPAPAPHPDS
ncbi:hypothetical protein GE061_002049 [Apolygus lucorum]|uniref:Uncharacterized protein n=1 Tax=Apolygus lucorum TaxID=248454 RepID=A0A6A4JJM4_APOLU|nr:hypothetical protein GE061_002049 [Apolygus lucorum]